MKQYLWTRIEETFECIFLLNSTLEENIRLLLDCFHQEINSYLVYEKDTLQKCSIHVPVKSLNLYDGMTLLLF